jgi:hypothetical protein
VTYGSYSSLTMPPYDELWPAESAPKEPLKLLDRKFSRQFYLEQARAFVWGQQPTIANFQPAQLEQRPEEMDYALRLARLRKQALKYLLRGIFLRPPDLHAPEATIDLSRLSIYAGQKEGLKSFQKVCPLAIAGAWGAPEGTLAVAVASIADDPLALSLNMDPAYYHLPPKTMVEQIDEAGRIKLCTISHSAPAFQLKLPARGACLLEFSAE